MGRPVCQRRLLIRCVCRGVVSGALWLHLCGNVLLDILLGDPDAVSMRCNGLLRGCSHLGVSLPLLSLRLMLLRILLKMGMLECLLCFPEESSLRGCPVSPASKQHPFSS